MKSVVETLNPTRVRLAVEVPFAELESNIQSAYKRIAAQVTVPGFRKGKVPPMVIDQRIGRPVVLEEAVNEAIPQIYQDAMRENELTPLAQPEIDSPSFGEGEDLKFTAEVTVKPKIDLPEWEGLEVQVDDIEASDDDISERLDVLRARFGTLVTVERAAANDDFVQIDLNATSDGEPVEGGQASGVSYQIGRGGMVEGLDEALAGLTAGETKSFRTTLVGTHEGEEVDVEVTVNAVKEQQLPELDDEFAQLASEFDTLDELRDDIRQQALNSKRIEQAMSARDKVLEQLIGSAGDIPLPEELITAQVEEHLADGHGDDDHRAEFEQNLRGNLTQQFVLDELVKAESIEVSQDELSSYIIQQAMRSRIDPNQLAQQLVDQGNLPAVVADVARGKALALAVEKAKVTDASGNAVELNRLREDGTLAEPGEVEGVAAPAVDGSFEFAELDGEAETAEAGEAETAEAAEAADDADEAEADADKKA
ncbi:trigger factor [Jiangella sp. DSM 45060]|uniref:trigger factor n=1 Tax=Jiangella sp. DSM 45060 TaxID=1798224 RepID=UPI00087A5FB8|nr:trigger factor [Jiangella sp. DSM 45060]SDT48690.1 trigger factor [Jiangella sp. DSM 45060]